MRPRQSKVSAGQRRRSQRQARRQLLEVRREFQAAIVKLKSLGCEDSVILVEFWHALDCVNGEAPIEL